MSDRMTPRYRITVEGKVHPTWSDWLEGMAMVSRTEPDGSQITILTGTIADQAALRGVLIRLWDLNLRLISIQQINPLETDEKMESQTASSTSSVDDNLWNR